MYILENIHIREEYLNILRKRETQLAYIAVYITKAFRLKSRLYRVCVSIYIHKHTNTYTQVI